MDGQTQYVVLEYMTAMATTTIKTDRLHWIYVYVCLSVSAIGDVEKVHR